MSKPAEKFRLRNGLIAEILRVNDVNGKRKMWPNEISLYGNSFIVNLSWKTGFASLLLCGNCLYWNDVSPPSSLFLPATKNAVKELLQTQFNLAVKFATCILYKNVVYHHGDVAFTAVQNALLTGKTPELCALLGTPLNIMSEGKP